MFESIQKKWFVFVTILMLFSVAAGAQIIKGKTNKSIAEQAIIDLRDGALVLRLKSKHNKITKLEELLAKPDIDEKDRKKLEKELANTIRERDLFNTELVASFVAHYKFSAIYFMYDTSSVVLKNGGKSGFLLDQDLKVDPEITITQDSFFVIYSGTLDVTDRTGLEALIILDCRFEIIPSPFPYYVKVNNFWSTLGRFFSPDKAIKKDAQKIVPELENNLREYYKFTVEKWSNKGIPVDSH